MSATNRGSEREEADFYETPGWVTRSVLPVLGDLTSKWILEPCAGRGAVAKELLDCGAAMIVTVEKNEERANELRDMSEAHPWRMRVENEDFLARNFGVFDLVMTNPPYRLAMEFVRHSMTHVHPGGAVVMLLRLNWLAGLKRSEWLRENTPSIYVLPKRPSFTGGGTDATDYAWMVWRKNDFRSKFRSTVNILEVAK